MSESEYQLHSQHILADGKMEWCDICMGVGEVNHSATRLLINPQPRRPIFMLMICDEHAINLGLIEKEEMLPIGSKRYKYNYGAVNHTINRGSVIHCPAYSFPDKAKYPKCEILRNLGKRFKVNCEACIRTRTRNQLGIHDPTWFDTWGREKLKMPLMKTLQASFTLGELQGAAGLGF